MRWTFAVSILFASAYAALAAALTFFWGWRAQDVLRIGSFATPLAVMVAGLTFVHQRIALRKSELKDQQSLLREQKVIALNPYFSIVERSRSTFNTVQKAVDRYVTFESDSQLDRGNWKRERIKSKLEASVALTTLRRMLHYLDLRLPAFAQIIDQHAPDSEETDSQRHLLIRLGWNFFVDHNDGNPPVYREVTLDSQAEVQQRLAASERFLDYLEVILERARGNIYGHAENILSRPNNG